MADVDKLDGKCEHDATYFQGAYAPPFLMELVGRQVISTQEFYLWMTINSFQRAGRECWMTNKTLGNRIGIHERMVQYHIKHMVELMILHSAVRKNNFRVLTTNHAVSIHTTNEENREGVCNTLHRGVQCIARGVCNTLHHKKRIEEESSPQSEYRLSAVFGNSTKKPNSGRAQKVYLHLWNAKYGTAYPNFKAKDAAGLKKLHDAVGGDIAQFRSVVKRYLADDSNFFRGHPVSKLVSDLNRFVVVSSQQSGSDGTGAIIKGRPVPKAAAKAHAKSWLVAKHLYNDDWWVVHWYNGAGDEVHCEESRHDKNGVRL